VKRVVEIFKHLLVSAAALPIRFYQRFVSPAIPRRCKYEPSCSSYALSALRSYGLVRGSLLAGWRILRCNPLSHGGYDPVEAQTLFRRGARSSTGNAGTSGQGSASQRSGVLT
jgi:putative membrane protein insertion efficiency factor